jgi:AraC-like DNA-binding protein
MTRFNHIVQFATLMQQHPEWEVPSLARKLCVNPVQLGRLCKRLLGLSAKQWLLSYRMRCWRVALQEQGEVLDSALDHFGALSTAYRHAAHALGMSPASLRKGGAGARIVFGALESEWGPLCVAVTSMGVCWVCADTDMPRALGELIETYPNAELTRNDTRFVHWATTLTQRTSLSPTQVSELSTDAWLSVLQHHLFAFVDQSAKLGNVAHQASRPPVDADSVLQL